ncbi:helix-turn-helix domain-containing protein, partial [Streptomyces sp. NPDC002172]
MVAAVVRGRHRGWTQTQLAEALGTSQSAVNRIER